ncbi:BZ3500_MvSof-1268-A1-R1_Chr9g10320 [Microbotryum saponariae]|uniref:Kinetochore protein NDC80 n=1 Tax=Microbotryum saponariae TaxID=289078 RepID=A0A2X0L4R5_9BASI|nr:BZ3501_MvSof-1269-A2-R1_Chr9g10070 [Microbotryum saponariae]SCZ99900.1 BZ3500_MvSof-1268-A1-R1_Chr9g10320 [Microbotryum saponariae]
MDTRRRTLATSGANPTYPGQPPQQQGQSMIPTSTRKPTHASLRQSMLPSATTSTAAGTTTTTVGGPRASIAPSRSNSNLSMTARQSMLPGSSANVNNNNNNNNNNDVGAASSQTSSWGGASQVFSQGHGGPPAPTAPMTATRPGAYHVNPSLGSMSVGRPTGGMRGSSILANQHPALMAPNSARRSSSFRRSTIGNNPGGNPSSLSTPGGLKSAMTTMKPKIDPREAKKKSSETRKQWALEIVDFLLECQFAADEKMLLAPTGAQWQAIFKTLVFEFDPTITWEGKSFNDQVPIVLNEIGYPFPASITKSHLQSAGSSQSWPGMLAMMHWIVTTIKESEAAFNESTEIKMPDFDAVLAGGTTDEDHLVQHAWFDYVASAYPKFLVSDEFEADEEKDLFWKRMDPVRRVQRDRLDELTIEYEKLEREWKELQAHPDPLIELSAQVEGFKRDELTCRKWTDELTEKLTRYTSEHERVSQVIQQTVSANSNSLNEIASLEDQVKNQDMSQAEIAETNSECKRLDSTTRETRNKIVTTLKRVLEQEIEVERHLALAKRLAEEYSNIVGPLGLLRNDLTTNVALAGLLTGHEDVDFNQEISPASDNPAPDCTTYIKPALSEMKVKTKAELRKLQADEVTKEAEVKIKQVEESDQEEISKHLVDEEKRLMREMQALEESAANEFGTLNASIAALQSAVDELSSTMAQPFAQAEYRLEQRTLELSRVTKEASSRLQENSTKFEQALSRALGHKEHTVACISKGLEMVEEAKRTWIAPPVIKLEMRGASALEV